MRKRLQRLLDLVAPVRPPGEDRGYRCLLRWAALPVTDRRWAAPLAAAALGFGLFAGVAIGPGAPGTLATGTPQVIELPSLLANEDGGGQEASGPGGGEGAAPAEAGEEAGAEAAFPEEEASSSAFEVFPEAEETAEAPASEPAPSVEEEPADESEEEEPAQTMAGLVVHANPAAGSYTVVEAGGLMNAIHAAKLPVPGTKVSVPARTLANGTYAEEGKRKQEGKRGSATIAGVVTFVDPDPAAPAYAVSKRGVSVLVRVRPDPTGAPAALPRLGAYATVEVEIERLRPAAGAAAAATAETPPAPVTSTPPPAPTPVPEASPTVPPPTCAPDPAVPPVVPAATAVLWQRSVDADGAPFASSDFAGVVTALCPSEAKLSLSGDDLRQAGADIVFTVPPSIDVTGLTVGDSVAAAAKIEADGSLTLTGLASDERTKGADDAKTAQGDLASHKPQ